MTPEEKKGAKILIVDDEPVARRLISSVLALNGYMTFEDAETGEAALDILKKKQFDLVMLDKNMPGVDGIEVLRQGKIIQPFCQFIMITAYGTEDTVVEAIELGAHSYLTKPLVNVEEIAQRVEAALIEGKKRAGKTAGDEPAPGSLQDVDLAEVTERITDSTSKLQVLADRLKEMKRKKD
jgi:DNA-binding NtrC family response regulator